MTHINELTQTLFFWTSNELERVHLLVIELKQLFFGLKDGKSNFQHCSTHHYHIQHMLIYKPLFFTGLLTIVAFLVYFLISRLTLLKYKKKESNEANQIEQTIRQKWMVEYYLLPTFMLFQDSVAGLHLFDLLERKTRSGMIFTISMIMGGFWIKQYYNLVLLTFLLKPSYEKQIDTVAGL